MSERSAEELAELFSTNDRTGGGLVADHNVAPTRLVPAVVADAAGSRALRLLRCGLVPPWAAAPSVGSRMLNARAGTLSERPAYRRGFALRRCLLPAEGFYEWQPAAQTGGRGSQPWYVSASTEGPLTMAGLYEHWTAPDGSRLSTCAIVTTSAGADTAWLHDRSPVLLRTDAEQARWLDRSVTSPTALAALLGPPPPGTLTAWPVARAVGNVASTGPQLREPVTLPQPVTLPGQAQPQARLPLLGAAPLGAAP